MTDPEMQKQLDDMADLKIECLLLQRVFVKALIELSERIGEAK